MYPEPSTQNWKIIKHPLHQTMKSSWFDLRVFYMRISNCEVEESTPDHLTVNHYAVSPDTILEVNGRSGNSCSGSLSSLLRRDRADKRTEEATFVSTDKIRMTGSVRFEICHKDDILFSGLLELINSDEFIGESRDRCKKWSITHLQIKTAGVTFLKRKQHMGLETEIPTVDVYVTGCFSGSHIILAETLQLGFTPKHDQKAKPASTLGNHLTDLRMDGSSEALQRAMGSTNWTTEDQSDIDINGLHYRLKHLHEEDVELSWFNAGVRVGVGIGLGISLGVGIGVGLLVRSYRTAVSHLRR
ncbi:unnamed protein product [Spirodela intermedia]|uniref:Uncharacterized protein n=1 Tax=Spirodela intermedia TaxID=51605 RepID=A0A7I8JVU6_SPIIN|nr:unnamed protein product [Spirodela intermedia]